MTYPRATVFDDAELAHKYASATGARHVRVAGDDRKQLATLIAIGGQLARDGLSFALSFEGPAVSIPVGRMMLRILLGRNAVACCSGQSSGFYPGLPLVGFPIVAPSSNLRQLLAILSRVATSFQSIPANPGIGCWSDASVLLVGDRPSASWPAGAPNFPFVSALASGCSAWLATQLELSGIDEGMLYWTNGYTQKGERQPSDWIDALEPRGIIALGGAAQNWLDGSGVKSNYQVHHPQYWKRFQSKNTYVLGRYVNKLLGRG